MTWCTPMRVSGSDNLTCYAALPSSLNLQQKGLGKLLTIYMKIYVLIQLYSGFMNFLKSYTCPGNAYLAPAVAPTPGFCSL